MICSATGINPEDISLDLSHDGILPFKTIEVRKNECLPPQFTHNEREAYSWQNDGYLATFSHVYSIFKLGIIRIQRQTYRRA